MNSNSHFNAPPSSGVRRPPWAGLYVLLLGGFVTMFDLFVVNVAIPAMQRALDANFSGISFIIVGYELAFGMLLITGSRLGDLFGRRRLFIIGMACFTLASALCGLAPTAGFLIGARVLQGFSAALLFPQVYASIRVNFTGHPGRKAFAMLGMTLGLAAIAGQVLGGWLIHANLLGLGWRTIFLINIPVGLLAIFSAHAIPESCAEERPGLDWVGVCLIGTGLALLMVALLEGSGQGWPTWSFISLAAALTLLVLFYHQQERRRIAGELPLVDMQLLTQQHFMTGALLVLLVYSTSSSFFLCFALLLQSGFKIDPFMAGSIFAPCRAGFVLASLAAPAIVARWGTTAIAIGALIYAISNGLLITQVGLAGASLIPAHLIPVLAVVGAGQGIIMTPLLNLVLGFTKRTQAGMASGVISTLQQVGAALGVAATGILFSRALANACGVPAADRYASAFVSGMLYNVFACMVICVLLFMLAKRKKE